jgi:hypothetical protein
MNARATLSKGWTAKENGGRTACLRLFGTSVYVCNLYMVQALLILYFRIKDNFNIVIMMFVFKAISNFPNFLCTNVGKK